MATTAYPAKQVFTQLGLKWRGADSVAELPKSHWSQKPLATKVGDRTIHVKQYALSEAGVKALCKKHNKSVFGFEAAPSKDTSKQVKKLEKTVSDMKVVLSKLLTDGSTGKITLPTKGVSAKLVKNDPLQVQARQQVRQLVQDYASARANDLGITDDSRRLFFDLSFKALYNAYKESTPNKIDLKALADEQTAKGTKVSGLQIAERLGLAIELLQFAKAFYKQN